MQELPNTYSAGSDEFYMYEALQLAHEGLGWTSPNPLVGAVLVRDNTIIGRGAHLHDGQEHAEVRALQAARDAHGATCYVTLEPCTHVGRQPACCQELARAGVTRVVYGTKDSDSRTAGQADRVLTELGISHESGVLAELCADFLDYYLYSRILDRAFFHLKLALSLDAKVACANGQSQWLSGAQSLGYAHYLRQKYDAILVGHRTVRADDPRLSVRLDAMQAYRRLAAVTQARNPVRIILDPRFELLQALKQYRLYDSSGVWQHGRPHVVVAGLSKFAPRDLSETPDVVLIALDECSDGQFSFVQLAQRLLKLGISSVLVEGGAGVAQAIIKQQSVDKMTLVYTPAMIGDDGMGFTPALHKSAISDCTRLAGAKIRALGNDCVLEGYPSWE